MIVDKCMERNSGIFKYIPEFDALKHTQEKTGGGKYIMEELGDAKLRNLYNDSTILSFYEHSNALDSPGDGLGEKVPFASRKQFAELASMEHWRRKLSREWIQPFSLDNHRWASVEHYIQASKYKHSHPDFYLTFSLDSGTELSQNTDMAKAVGSNKSGKYKGELIRAKDIKADSEWNRNKVQELAERAKYSQHEDLKKVLLATKNAKLTQHIRGEAPEVMDSLMVLREELRHGTR
jgi:predicted NAD-dependent protein-ADP-ribosyltransferase YbiA (DUF1768 family)